MPSTKTENELWRTKLHPIFTDAVAEESTRYAIEAPFKDGDYVCATNGHICVRQSWCDEMSAWLPVFGEPMPPISELRWGDEYAATPLPLPDLALLEPEILKCEECVGTGNHYCNCDYCEQVCDYCDGTGECKEYKKIVWRRPDLSFCLDAKYVGLFAKHGVKIHSPIVQPENRPFLAKINGDIEGLIVPVDIAYINEDEAIIVHITT